MPFPLLSSEGNLTDPSEAFSIVSLLECGIQCAQQGSYAEGAVFFALVREQLTLDQAHLAAALEAIIRSNANYYQAQEMLHLASKRFAEADSEQRNLLAAVQKLLPKLSEKADQIETNSLTHAMHAPQELKGRSPSPVLHDKAGDPLPD